MRWKVLLVLKFILDDDDGDDDGDDDDDDDDDDDMMMMMTLKKLWSLDLHKNCVAGSKILVISNGASWCNINPT